MAAGIAPAARAAATAAASTTAAAPAPSDDPRALRYPPLTIAFPQPERFSLKNGLTIHLLRDPELPIVDLAFFLRGGSVYDPADKPGLAEVATHLMRTGGSSTLSPDQVDETLEGLPAELSIEAASDALSGSLSCLKPRFPEALAVLAGLLRTPRFDAARLEVEKAQLVESIRRRWDDPGTIADAHFRFVALGADSPWARLATVQSIAGIGRDDLVAFHRRFVRPGSLVLAVSGDFEPETMKALLKRTFADWSGPSTPLPALAKIGDGIPHGVSLIDRPLTQSSIVVGDIGATRFDPDKFPLFVLNYILGEGGFSSRLMKEVRSARGLAYSVHGGVGTDSDRGLLEISCRTRADATVQAIEAIRDVVKRLREEGPTDQEVRGAKEARLNSFVFTVDGTAAYMQAYLFYLYYGYPVDYLKTWRDNLARVTREDVQRAARRFLHPERLAFLVVGDAKKFDRPLASLGDGEAKVIPLGEEGGPPPR
jgi:predicted Zn-dependent peptidase